MLMYRVLSFVANSEEEPFCMWVTKNAKLVQDVKQKWAVLLQDHCPKQSDAALPSISPGDVIRSVPMNLTILEPGGCIITSTTLELFCLLDRSIGDGDFFFQQSVQYCIWSRHGRGSCVRSDTQLHELRHEVTYELFQRVYWTALTKRRKAVINDVDKDANLYWKEILLIQAGRKRDVPTAETAEGLCFTRDQYVRLGQLDSFRPDFF